MSLTEKVGSKKGIGLTKVISAEFNKDTSNENRKVTSVSFEIPVAFPIMADERRAT